MANKKFEAQTLTGNPTENPYCRVLPSRALIISFSFGQSVRSLESMCLVISFSLGLPPIKIEYYGKYEDKYDDK